VTHNLCCVHMWPTTCPRCDNCCSLIANTDPLKSWIEERAAESGLAFRAARKRLEEAQDVSES